MKGIFVEIKDVMILEDLSYQQAFRKLRTVRDCLGKKKKNKVTVREYCESEQITEEDFKKAIDNYYKGLNYHNPFSKDMLLFA